MKPKTIIAVVVLLAAVGFVGYRLISRQSRDDNDAAREEMLAQLRNPNAPPPPARGGNSPAGPRTPQPALPAGAQDVIRAAPRGAAAADRAGDTTAIPRPPRPAPATQPTVAMVDFSADTDSYIDDYDAANFSDLLQMMVISMPSVRWVDRQRLHDLQDELGLGAFTSTASDAVRIGRWASADLLVRGRFIHAGTPESLLRLEAIDLHTADVLTSSEIPGGISAAGDVSPGLLDTTAATVTKMIGDARQATQQHQGRTFIAPLTFRNISQTDRLDYLESQLLDDLTIAAEKSDKIHVLRFSRADDAADESELTLMGLSEGAPDTWKWLADIYVWGSYRELEQQQAKTDAQDIEVELRLISWNGMDPPQEFTEQAKVRDLPAARQQLADRIFEYASTHRSEAVSEATRAQMVKRLAARAEELFQAAREVRRDAPEYAAQTQRYVHHLMDVAVFLQPDDARLRRDASRYIGLSPRAGSPLDWAMSTLARQRRVLELFGPFDMVGNRVSSYWRLDHYVTGIARVFSALENPPADMPLPVSHDLRERLLRQFIHVGRDAFGQADTPAIRWRDYGGTDVIKAAMSSDCDPRLVVEALEAWWPSVGTEFRRQPPPSLRRVYAAIGNPGGADLLLARDPAPPAPARAARPPAAAPAVPAIVRRSGPPTIKPLNPADFAEIEPPAPPQVSARLQARAVARGSRRLQPDFIPLNQELPTPRHAEPAVVAVPPLDIPYLHWWIDDQKDDVTDIEWVAGRLWRAVARATAPLIAHEAGTDCVVDTSRMLPSRGAIGDLVAVGDHLWIATQTDGLIDLDPATGESASYGSEQGLASRSIARIGVLGDRIAAITSTNRLSLLKADRSGFDDIALPEGLSINLDDAGPLGVGSKGLIARRGENLVLFDPAAGEVSEPPEPIAALAAGTDGTTLAALTDRELIRWNPNSNELIRTPTPVPQGQARRVTVDGPFVWVVWQGDRVALRGNGSGETRPESRIALWHAPDKQWIGQLAIQGEVRGITRGGARVWIAIIEKNNPTSVVQIVTSDCYAAAGDAFARDSARRAAIFAHPDATELMKAAYLGDAAAVGSAIGAGADVNVTTSDGWTALMFASAQGHAEVVRALIAADADVKTKRNHDSDRAALAYAARGGWTACVRALLDAGADPRAPWPIEEAVRFGRVETVKALLDAGARLDLPVRTNIRFEALPARTPLALAVREGHLQVARMLLESDARTMFAQDLSALEQAVAVYDLDAARMLLDGGVDPNAPSRSRPGLVWLAVQGKYVPMLDLLLARNVDPGKEPIVQKSPLVLACHNNLIDVAHKLLAAGANPDQAENGEVGTSSETSHEYVSPFMEAADHYNGALMKLLLEAGADLQTKMGGRPEGDLLLVRAYRSPELAGLLLKAGFDPNAQDHEGTTALTKAAKAGGNLEVVRLLLEYGADPMMRDREGHTALQVAAGSEKTALLRSVMPEDAAPPVKLANRALANPLLVAAVDSADAAGVKAALVAGADVRTKDGDKWPVIVLAAARDDEVIVGDLLQANAPVNETGPGGWTALMQAARRGNAEMVRMLLDAKADPAMQDTFKRTARDIAVESDHTEIAAMLPEPPADQP